MGSSESSQVLLFGFPLEQRLIARSVASDQKINRLAEEGVESVDVGRLCDVRLQFPNDGCGRRSNALVASFETANVSHTHSISWSIELYCAGTRREVESQERQMVRLVERPSSAKIEISNSVQQTLQNAKAAAEDAFDELPAYEQVEGTSSALAARDTAFAILPGRLVRTESLFYARLCTSSFWVTLSGHVCQASREKISESLQIFLPQWKHPGSRVAALKRVISRKIRW